MQTGQAVGFEMKPYLLKISMARRVKESCKCDGKEMWGIMTLATNDVWQVNHELSIAFMKLAAV